MLKLLAGERVSDPVQLMGLTFSNRVGLAAGLDKNGAHLAALDDLGFGFIEAGTVTPKPQPGNPKPRLFRLPEQQAMARIFDQAPDIQKPDTSWYHPVMDAKDALSRQARNTGSVLLTAKQEQALFVQFNYCRMRVCLLRDELLDGPWGSSSRVLREVQDPGSVVPDHAQVVLGAHDDGFCSCSYIKCSDIRGCRKFGVNGQVWRARKELIAKGRQGALGAPATNVMHFFLVCKPNFLAS